jgi:PTH1 family peptidyl-tRNA hydrolase
MKLIVGLGNPGEKYVKNRHNVGFMFADFLAKKIEEEKTAFKEDKYTDSQVIKLNFKGEELIIAKPQTYMNRSGQAVSKLMKFYSIKIEDLIIAHDDLDIPLGKSHIQTGVGPQLHNGLESIESHLKSKNFLRVRIGVDARTKERWIGGMTYVLSDFLNEEIKILEEIVFPKIADLLKYGH